MQLDDAYASDEPVSIRLRLKEVLSEPVVSVTLQNAASGTTTQLPVSKTEDGWVAAAGELEPGSYRVHAIVNSAEARGSVKDVFAVEDHWNAVPHALG